MFTRFLSFFCVLTCAIVNITRADTTFVSSVIQNDTYWDSTGSPYVIAQGLRIYGLSTSDRPTLRIGPGAKLLLGAGAHITLGVYWPDGINHHWGRIVTEGTADHKVVITSIDHSGSAPWGGIYGLYTDYDTLLYTDVQYGGFSLDGMLGGPLGHWYLEECSITNSESAGIFVGDESINPAPCYIGIGVTLRNCRITDNVGTGVFGCITDMMNCQILRNGSNGIGGAFSGECKFCTFQQNVGLAMDAGSGSGATTFQHNLVSANGGGVVLYLSGPAPSVDSNTFEFNAGTPLQFSCAGGFPSMKGNSFVENGRQEIDVGSSQITHHSRIENPGIPYRVTNTIVVQDLSSGYPGVILRISPGVELRMADGAGIQLGASAFGGQSYRAGRLVSEGTSELRVTITAADGNSPNSWGRIYGWYTDFDTLRYTDVEYGGGIGNAMIENGNWYFEGCRIHGSAGRGIRLYDGGQAEVRNCAIYNNQGTGIELAGGSIGITAQYSCDLHNNGNYNVAYGGGNVLNAEYNCWGTTLVSEILSRLSGNIDFEPFMMQQNFRTMNISIQEPTANFIALLQNPMQITAQLESDLGENLDGTKILSCRAHFSNGEPEIQLYDDGQHNDYAAIDGFWGATWVPTTQGPVTITVVAKGQDYGTEIGTVQGNVDQAQSTAPLKTALSNFTVAFHDYLDRTGDVVFSTLAYQYQLMYLPDFASAKRTTIGALNASSSVATDFTKYAELVNNGTQWKTDTPASFAQFLAWNTVESGLNLGKDDYLSYFRNNQLQWPGPEFKNRDLIILSQGQTKSINELVNLVNVEYLGQIPDYVSATFPMSAAIRRLKSMSAALLIRTATSADQPPTGEQDLLWFIPGSCSTSSLRIGSINQNSIAIRNHFDETMALHKVTLGVSASCGSSVNSAKNSVQTITTLSGGQIGKIFNSVFGKALTVGLTACNFGKFDYSVISTIGALYLTVELNSFIQNWPLDFAESYRFYKAITQDIVQATTDPNALGCSDEISDNIMLSPISDICIPVNASSVTVYSWYLVTNNSADKPAVAQLVGSIDIASGESGDPSKRLAVSLINSSRTQIAPGQQMAIPFDFEVPARDWPIGYDSYKINARVITSAGERYLPLADVHVLGAGCVVTQKFTKITSVMAGKITNGAERVSDIIAGPKSILGIFQLRFPGSNIDLHVYDGQGNHVGRNYLTGQMEFQIQGAEFFGDSTNLETIQIPLLANSNYTAKIVAVDVSDSENVAVDLTEVESATSDPQIWPRTWILRSSPSDSLEIQGSVIDNTAQHMVLLQVDSLSSLFDNSGHMIPTSNWTISVNGSAAPDRPTILSIKGKLSDSVASGDYSGCLKLRASDSALVVPITISIAPPVPSYVSGDADSSCMVNIADAVYLIAYIFSGGSTPKPYEAGDEDCSGAVNISDVVYLISYIFIGGPPPCGAK